MSFVLMRFKEGLKKNLAFAFLLVGMIFANYLSSLTKVKNHFHMAWGYDKFFALLLLHILLIVIFAFLFSFVKNKYLRSLIPVYFFTSYISYFFKLNFFILLGVCVFISVKPFYKLLKIKKIKYKIYPLTLIISLVFIGSMYATILLTENYSFSANYVKDFKVANDKALSLFEQKALPKNVFFLLFDKLSYQRLYLDNASISQASLYPSINNKYPNIRELGNNAWNFHAVFSPYDHTNKSIPAIIFGDYEDYSSSIADYFSGLGYQTKIVGNYINYCGLIKNANFCKSYHSYNVRSKYPFLLTEMARQFVYVLISGELTLRKIFLKQQKIMEVNRQKIMVDDISKDLDLFLDRDLKRNFIYVHFPVPHEPFIYDRNGLKAPEQINQEIDKKLSGKSANDDRLHGYLDNLEYVDNYVGKFVSRMKELGIYEDAMIIVTSDHSFQRDPGFKDIESDANAFGYWQNIKSRFIAEEEDDHKIFYSDLLGRTHVPLIVKMPGQNKFENNNTQISNSRLFSDKNNYVFSDNLVLNSKRIENLNSAEIFVEPQFSTNIWSWKQTKDSRKLEHI